MIYVGMYVCMYVCMSVCRYVYKKYVHQNVWEELRKVGFWQLKLTCDTHIILYARAALAWMKKKPKKCSLGNDKLKANRASETEEQRKERLMIRHEQDRAKKKKKIRSSETEDHEKQIEH